MAMGSSPASSSHRPENMRTKRTMRTKGVPVRLRGL
jgi:hypothetical protein